jgi:hypothetical protein
MNKTKRAIIQAFNWLRFVVSSMKVFRGDSPELILKVIEIFVTIESPLYKDTLYLGRSIKNSASLLKSLVESYLETKSGVTLNQIMTVLKEEIIEREQENGREQLPSRPFRRSNS